MLQGAQVQAAEEAARRISEREIALKQEAARQAEQLQEAFATEKVEMARAFREQLAEQLSREQAAREEAERAAAERAVAEALATERAVAEKAAAELDAELRTKREEALEKLKSRRPRTLTDTLSSAAMDAALAAAAKAAAEGKEDSAVSAWAAEQREKLRAEAEAKEKHSRMALFASDLELLGIPLDDAVGLDEKRLRSAFRARSRVLHPDVRAQQRAEELDGVPSVYELNAAYEAVRQLL